MISIKNNFIFVHIPKTAGNSLQNILRNYSEDKIVCPAPYQDGLERFEVKSQMINTSKHASLSEYKKKLSTEYYTNAFKFTCIRNPWDRLISFYFSPHRKVNHWDRNEFLKFIPQVPSMLTYLKLPGQNTEAILTNFDYIIRFEELPSGFSKVCSSLSIEDKDLPVRNKANKQHYTHYYDDELIDKVFELFREEIELFDYAFNKT